MQSFRLWIGIAGGGALGSVARYAVSLAIDRYYSSAFPWATFLVNVIGALIIGFLSTLPDSDWKQMVMVGVLGGFTTFSAFSLQTMELVRSGVWSLACLNVIGSLLLCLLFVFLGFFIGTQFIAKPGL